MVPALGELADPSARQNFPALCSLGKISILARFRHHRVAV
jgi:hypothetical protein